MYVNIDKGDKPAEKLEKVVMSLHKRENGLIESFPGTLRVAFPSAWSS